MSKDYDEYLENHRYNVQRGYIWLRTNLPNLFDEKPISSFETCIGHDESKYLSDEYDAYDDFFYGGNCSKDVIESFQRAWLLHIHRNPHHWQYWILFNDDQNEGEVLLEMPYNYIVEMICDWWSFSWQKGDLSEIFNWYDEHSAYIKLAPKTREIVEDILWAIRGRLGYNVIAHHGIKGQKWGVRNGPPYPLDKSQKSDTLVIEALETGMVTKTINREKQLRHTLEGHTPGRSYIYGDLVYAQKLVNELAGTGQPVLSDLGDWLRMERVSADNTIGVWVDNRTGEEITTNKAMIRYSKTGAHIHPRKG